MPFDPFRRLRLRFRPPSVPAPSSEEDSDRSSPERDRPRIIHVPVLKSGRRSGEPLLGAQEDEKPSRSPTDRRTEATHIALALHKPPHTADPERPPKKSPKSGVASVTLPTDAIDALQPSAKPTLIRRVTSKLAMSIPSRSTSQSLRSRPSTRTLPSAMGPRPTQGPRAPTPAPSLPNGLISQQHREAALRERGLLPPRKDLSEQEREADQRLGCAPSPLIVTVNGSTEAERLKASWLAGNRTSESNDSECEPPTSPPYLRSTRSEENVPRRPSEEKSDLPPAGRPSFCSSVHPLSISSHLEVLHEEPSESPIMPPPALPRANLPVILASSLEPPPSPILVESPVSCTFSSHCPGSTIESQSQSSHRAPGSEKENIRLPPFRSRTTESGDRGRRVVGSSLSKLGTRSLSNLRRSVAGSLKVPSSSTLSSADQSSLRIAQPPRMAIEPTMHSLGSILRETKDIEDAESRRLSELAFLD